MTNGHYVFEEIYITNLNINFCKGCSSCFKNGTCKMNDDINMLKEKLLASDIIIISSPVFMNQITGCLKNILIDCLFGSYYATHWKKRYYYLHNL